MKFSGSLSMFVKNIVSNNNNNNNNNSKSYNVAY